MAFLQHFVQNPIVRMALKRLGKSRTDNVVAKITPFLHKKSKILDVGSGLGFIHKWLHDHKYSVVGLDIRDISIFPDIHPKVYDGNVIPYKTNAFDTALLLTVLHHIPDQFHVLSETSRVARKIIIMEDIYEGVFQKYLTFAMDSCVNLEFVGHPHTNRTDREWKDVFTRLGFRLVEAKYFSFWIFFHGAVYVVEKKD